MEPESPGIVIFTGGSASNSLVNIFNEICESNGCPLAYVIPISDNGGSSSELIRVFGGPGIGDVRSRLVRLIPTSGPYEPERAALRSFFNHRLAPDPVAARIEWLDIVEARHHLWLEISTPKKELIRSFLNLVNFELVKRARPTSVFNFQGASVGNMFLTGARLFSGSFESAVYLLSSICTIPSNVSVLPAINTNFSHHICAGLANGDTILGQNEISHPSEPTTFTQQFTDDLTTEPPNPHFEDDATAKGQYLDAHRPPRPIWRSLSYNKSAQLDLETHAADAIEDANLPGSLPTLRKPYLTVNKTYIPPTTPTYSDLVNAETSSISDDLKPPDLPDNNQTVPIPWMTSDILPSPIERIWYISPYGQEIRPHCNPKIPVAISSARAIIYSIGSLYTSLIPSLILRGVGAPISSLPSAHCQKILLLNGNTDRETSHLAHYPDSESKVVGFSASDFIAAIAKAGLESRGIFGREARAASNEWTDYVTHVVYVEGPGTPRVDRDELRAAGVHCVRVYGQRSPEEGGGMRYDTKALAQALEALIGRREHKRRNTLDHW